jgi:putative nucleotidyltransferase with HDIG domain
MQVFNSPRQEIRSFRPDGVTIYAAGLALAAVALLGSLVASGATLGGPIWVVALLAALAVLAERQPVRITSSLEATVTVLPVLFAAVVYGPLAAMVVGGCGVIGDFRRPWVRWITWLALRVLTAGAAGLAASVVRDAGDGFGVVLLAVAVAAVAESVVDVGLGAGVVALRRTSTPAEHVRSLLPILLATVPLHTSVVGLLAYAYTEVSAWSVLLFLGPAFAAQSIYRMYREEREAHEKLRTANARLEEANLSFATALVATLDARDEYTAGHSAAVAIYARDIARRMGLSDDDQKVAHLAGLVHDIGKIGLPAGLLEKPGPLSLDERRQMEKHSEIGERILGNVSEYAEIAAVVRHHHERVDGRGYPDGLSHETIPVLSRIIAVADAYNAMTSNRPYRDAMPTRVARLRLAQAVETQFDTTVVAAFEAILAGAHEEYRNGTAGEFGVVSRSLLAVVADAEDAATASAA